MKESVSTSSGGLNLAAELASSIPDWNNKEESESIQSKQLQAFYRYYTNDAIELTDENKMLQDTNRALQLYMNKILMKIINNKQLEDVLSIDQPPSKPIKPTPQPTKTVSTTTTTSQQHTTNSNTTNRQRRRTISYWGKVPPPGLKEETEEEDKRRHSSIPAAPQPERSVSTTTSSKNSGWAKALRRMSGIGWATATPIKDDNSSVNNDSAFSEEDRKSSGSSTPSLRRSNELGTLDEE